MVLKFDAGSSFPCTGKNRKSSQWNVLLYMKFSCLGWWWELVAFPIHNKRSVVLFWKKLPNNCAESWTHLELSMVYILTNSLWIKLTNSKAESYLWAKLTNKLMLLFVYLTENQDEVEEEDEGTSWNFLFTFTNLSLVLLNEAGHCGDLKRSRWTPSWEPNVCHQPVTQASFCSPLILCLLHQLTLTRWETTWLDIKLLSIIIHNDHIIIVKNYVPQYNMKWQLNCIKIYLESMT